VKEINLVAPLNCLGFGIFSIVYYKILKSRGYDINWHVIGHPHPEDILDLCDNFQLTPDEVDKDCCRPINPSCPSLTIWHPHEITKATQSVTGVRVGLTHFETDGLRTNETTTMAQMDKILVCSRWAKDVLYRHGVNRTDVIPGICAPMHMPKSEENDSVFRLGEYILETYGTMIVSCGKWEGRKGQTLQVDALLDPKLSNTSKIALIGFWNNVFTNDLQEPTKYLMEKGWTVKETIIAGDIQPTAWEHPSVPHTVIIVPYLNKMKDMHDIMKGCDLYITTSKGEGWDQPTVEAMALAVPVIGTYNTAHIEYFHEYYTFLIDCHTEEARDGVWFRGDRGNWYPPKQDQVTAAINEALSQLNVPNYLYEMGEGGKEAIKRICSDDNIVAKLEEALEL
jgi:glycosyltransferase involved in cell wall biosynthesis